MERECAEIMNMFRYYYNSEWAPESIFAGKSRAWIRAFNGLVESGYIVREKKKFGYRYKWSGVWPEGY
ncbi:hypothetical protein JXB11_02435 [Candidatus Woesearchaeota archaeon]|nr:hypothetical protein [Candidatus Woesearchaeota archaeon]